MRHVFIMLAVVAALALCCARAQALTLIRLSAHSVRFYYGRFLVEADGNVRVTTSDGLTMSGDAFSMDLKLNRFLLAGHVQVHNPSGSQQGAALADFLDFDRMYFIPIVNSAKSSAMPDRWTFLNRDFAHPAKGRAMPEDTFFFPDTGRELPFLTAHSATIGEKSFIRFPANRFALIQPLGVYIPTPSYYVNFSADQHLGDNSLAGASFDATYEFAGNANAISALHFRYDPTNKTYLAFEQHLSGKKAYAVFSLNPMTRPSKFWNLLTSYRPSDTIQFRTFTILHTFQFGLSRPLEAQQSTSVQATKAFPNSFLQLNTQLTNLSLLPPTPGGYEGHGVVPNHPITMQLTAQTFNHRIGKLPLYESLQYGFGYTHDAYGLQTLGGVTYTSIWQHNIGLQAYVPSLKIGNNAVETKNYYVNATFQKNRTWNSTPHYIDSTLATASLSRIFDRHFLAFTSYSIQHTGDYYEGALANDAYAPYVPVVGGVPVYGYAAFRGAATMHTLAFDVNYSNNGNFTASLLARKHADFPAPYPGLFPAPPVNILGQQQPGTFLGQPPYDITADVRARVNPFMSIDVSRSYYFNFDTLHWNPGFIVQITQ